MKNVIIKEKGKREKKLRLTTQQVRYMMNNCKKDITITVLKKNTSK